MQNKGLLIIFMLLGIVLFLMDLCWGSITIPFKDTLYILMGKEGGKSSWEYIIIHYRLPKAITAVLVGICLPVCGLLMQTLFRNPLAEPYALGLSSGSSFMVAIIIMASQYIPQSLFSIITSGYGLIIASSLGSLMVISAILTTAQKVKSTTSLLIIGLMFTSFTGALINIISYFSTAEQLQRFTFWSMGNIGNVSWSNIVIMACITLIGLISVLFLLKSFDALLLGENYAKSIGIPYKKCKIRSIFIICVLSGTITAFVGPIAFIGLAVPHLAKIIFKSSQHLMLFITTLLTGIIIMLLCDIISQGFKIAIPINAITSMVGAPVVIWLLLYKKRLNNE